LFNLIEEYILNSKLQGMCLCQYLICNMCQKENSAITLYQDYTVSKRPFKNMDVVCLCTDNQGIR